MSSELRQCTSCGGRVEFVYAPLDDESKIDDDESGRVKCESCGSIRTYRYDFNDAAYRYNRR